MSVPVGTCLQCGETKGYLYSYAARRDGVFCATVDMWGETMDEFPRHRFRDWPKKWLRQIGIKEEALAKYARVEGLHSWAVACEDLTTGHLPFEGDCARCGAPLSRDSGSARGD